MFQSGAGAIGEELSIDSPIELNYEPFLDVLRNNFPDGEVKPVLLFETSRGCWWGQRAHCTFCGLNGESMAYRSMRPEMALERFHEMFSFADRYSVFQSVDNILPKNYLTDVFPLLSAPNNINVFYEVK